ncbi:MAG: hypothetical protein B7Z08_04810 [Sphingomonadales bacterium 32-68-7]|nr:MAG: hypothetical protein B7Z33_08940 [Sphingomonadales bacterium 12-68-11]OYX09555.1 MAG: hypothetical protein B7Z08_04810 [Sphingomonadales bacterium 32-68-7]
MRGITGAIALVSTLAAFHPARAQGADYLAFGDHAKDVARIANSIGTCKSLGYDVDDRPQVLDELRDIALRTAVMADVDRQTAETMLVDALKREQSDAEFMTSLPAHIDTREKLVVRFRETMSFWNDRCGALASGDLGSRYVRKGANQPAAYEAVLQSAIARIEEASSPN